MAERDSGWRDRYEPVIGLEIHVQLRTRTKMFCGCELSFGDEPNVHTCPICLAHPGSLPVTNEQAVLYALQIALALECELAPRSIFHRKNYFYPDSPKGYQISQYDIPLASAGRLGDVRIHRVHLEEDAAKLIHVSESGRIHGSGASLVDFNRAGTPLVEIVTEPDLHDAAAARDWAQLLRTTVRQIGASDVNMEEGSLRVDANVSLRPVGSDQLGTKAELKNMNSFRFLERGIEAELARQAALLDAGERVVQETLHFDPRSGSLTSLRSKEEAQDYRYFPEPDLVPLAPSAEMIAAARDSLPELPAQRRERYASELALTDDAAALLAFDSELGAYFERVLAAAPELEAVVVAGWVANELPRDGGDAGLPDPAYLGETIGLVQAKRLSRDAARQVLRGHGAGLSAGEVVEREGLAHIDDSAELAEIVARAIAADPEAAKRVGKGNMKAIGPLVGFVMRETRGRADGGEVTRLIREQLGG
ncbi:MAG: aspartyl-tRNA(Asn)/glutamyl-tRNA(Gln) amidotransferase subunit [Sphingomonadales bacterium]|nr:aspartyl-tRNA(Asn)/glutamyl-tRNA(Gln) amidotransferase subunit [Sphingomonadales bacterium]